MTADPWSIVTEDAGAYIGVPMLLLLLLAWQRLRHVSAAVRWAVPVTGITTVLSLGPHLHLGGVTTAVPLPWIVFDRLPFLEDLDAARLMVLAWVGIAVVVAVAVDRALSQRGRERVLRCALIAAALLTLLPAAMPVTAASAPPYITSADAAAIPAGDTVLIVPLIEGSGFNALIWQVQAGLRWRMVNGNAYGSNGMAYYPATTLTNTLAALELGARADVSSIDVTGMRDDLRRLGVGTVILSGGAQRDQELTLMRRVLGPETYMGGAASVWHNVAGLLAGG